MKGDGMVAWWWIPASFGLALVGAAIGFFLMNLGSFFRYLKISSM
jgi:hypothetical protein